MVFLQSYMITPGGRLLETKNKRICQISGLIATLVKVLLKFTPVPHAKRYYSVGIGRGIHVGDHFLLFLMTLYSSKS